MWSGGLTGPIRTAAEAERARDEMGRLGEEATKKSATSRDAQSKVGDLNYDHGQMTEKEGLAKYEKQRFEGEDRTYTEEERRAREGVIQERHDLQIGRDQLGQRWREWSSSSDVANVLKVNFERRLASFISREVAAFLDEARQKQGEIERCMFAIWQRFSARVAGSTPSSGSTELAFATYTRLDVPENDSLSQIAQVRGEYNKLIAQGEELAKREQDPFTSNKLNEVVGRLQDARQHLATAEREYAAAKSAEKVARNAVLSARKVSNQKQDAVEVEQQKASAINRQLQNYESQRNDEIRREQADAERRRQQQQPRRAPA
jgi:hypothetical protein